MISNSEFPAKQHGWLKIKAQLASAIMYPCCNYQSTAVTENDYDHIHNFKGALIIIIILIFILQCNGPTLS